MLEPAYSFVLDRLLKKSRKDKGPNKMLLVIIKTNKDVYYKRTIRSPHCVRHIQLLHHCCIQLVIYLRLFSFILTKAKRACQLLYFC